MRIMSLMMMMLPTITAFLKSSMLYPRAHDIFFSAPYHGLTNLPSCSIRQPPSRTPTWTASADAFVAKMIVPDMEADSIGADLIEDESGRPAVKVTGTRKIDGCSCQPTAVREVPLPFRPRPEDVRIHADGSVVTVKLARGHAEKRQPKSTPLTVTKQPASTEHERQASKASLEAQERSLAAKFRAVAHAATAVATPPAVAKPTAVVPTPAMEAAPTTEESNALDLPVQ